MNLMIHTLSSPSTTRSTWSCRPDLLRLATAVFAAVFLIAVLVWTSLDVQATLSAGPKKLPSAEKIVENHLKAVGGKKRLAAIRDVTREWTIQLNEQPIGTARIQTKAPASFRSEMQFGNGQIIAGATPASAWLYGLDKRLLTLTGPEAAAAKLNALLEASHLIDYKKSNVMPRVISLGDLASEPAYIVEFSTRGGARLRYWFSVKSNLLVKIEDEARKTTTHLGDYKPTTAQPSLLEPHLLRLKTGDGELTFKLQHASYNTSISGATFDPPTSDGSLDIVGLLLEVARNQEVVEKRVGEYAFIQKETDRELNDKGELKKEKTKTYEVFPVAHREPVMKLISENGVTLTGERAAKEAKRVEEELLKVEREREKTEEKIERRRAERLQRAAKGETDQDEDPTISQFLKACEFVSPRRERFRDREAIVFDFRPRSGFKPSNRAEILISKLVGVAWIDPADKQVMRLEARMSEGFKMAGGLVLSLRPGAGFVMEQTRMAEGIWLPRFAHVNLSLKVFIFRGVDVNKTIEWSEYKHFKSDVGDYRLDTPKTDALDKKP